MMSHFVQISDNWCWLLMMAESNHLLLTFVS